MPNHFHANLWIGRDNQGTASCAPTIQQFGQLVSGSLPAIIRGFKSAVSNHFNKMNNTNGNTIWQRNYYEHVIGDEQSLNRIREYIMHNALNWEMDRENLERKGEDRFYQWLASFKSAPKAKKL